MKQSVRPNNKIKIKMRHSRRIQQRRVNEANSLWMVTIHLRAVGNSHHWHTALGYECSDLINHSAESSSVRGEQYEDTASMRVSQPKGDWTG